jgi:hypothetical protein
MPHRSGAGSYLRYSRASGEALRRRSSSAKRTASRSWTKDGAEKQGVGQPLMKCHLSVLQGNLVFLSNCFPPGSFAALFQPPKQFGDTHIRLKHRYDGAEAAAS